MAPAPVLAVRRRLTFIEFDECTLVDHAWSLVLDESTLVLDVATFVSDVAALVRHGWFFVSD